MKNIELHEIQGPMKNPIVRVVTMHLHSVKHMASVTHEFLRRFSVITAFIVFNNKHSLNIRIKIFLKK